MARLPGPAVGPARARRIPLADAVLRFAVKPKVAETGERKRVSARQLKKGEGLCRSVMGNAEETFPQNQRGQRVPSPSGSLEPIRLGVR